MPEETHGDSNFKVVDRRSFTVEGARREDAPPKEERATELEKKFSGQATGPAVSPAVSPAAAPAANPADERLDERFAMLVELLTNGALTHLGLIDDGGGALPVNLAEAGAMIELLGVIRDKTQGNLSAAEQKFLGQILFELHTRFVEAQRQAAPKPK